MGYEFIDLKSLKLFITFCDYLNMSKTAEILHLTQPAVSHHIGLLEKQFKTMLVDREVRPMVLTQAGRLLKQRGVQHLAELNTTAQLLLNKQFEFIADLKIGISELLADLALEAIGEQLSKIAEHLTIESSKSSTLFEKLLNRDLDIIITSKSGENYPDLESKLIYQEPIVGIYNSTLKNKPKKKSELQELISRKINYIEFMPSLTLGIALKQYFYRLNLIPTSKIKVDSAKNALLLINSLPCWGIGIPLLIEKFKSELNHIQIFDLPEPSVDSTWHLIYRRHEYEKAADMIDTILRKFLNQF
jgi:DNA-binding transcriptional LysR family regulator